MIRRFAKRLGAWLLTLALLFGSAPDWGFLTRAAAEDAPTPAKVPFSINAIGK